MEKEKATNESEANQKENIKKVEGLTDHEIDKLEKLLRNAYIELCRAEKLLKGLDNDNRQSNT